MKAVTFWTLASISGVTTAIALYFFVIGIADGTVNSPNIGYWFLVLACPAAMLGSGFWLRSLGRVWLAITALALLALPAIGCSDHHCPPDPESGRIPLIERIAAPFARLERPNTRRAM